MPRITIYRFNFRYLLPLLYFLSNDGVAHGGGDPNKELSDKQSLVVDYQRKFRQEIVPDKKYRNLNRQLQALQSRILILRNELVKDRQSQCFKKDTDIDYFSELSQTLKMTNKTLKQTKIFLKENN